MNSMSATAEAPQETADKTTPMMAQWNRCKAEAKEAILLFRMGDFYEAFYEDAEVLAKDLALTLTKRQGIPMSGVPHHTAEAYIDKLVAKGHRVAIAEQTEDPKKAKGIVKREVVRIVTPGTLVNSSLLSEKNNNYFAALHQIGSIYGLAFLDLTTGEFQTTEFEKIDDLTTEICKIRPAEILTPKRFSEKHPRFFADLKSRFSFLHNMQEDWFFTHEATYAALADHFKVQSLDGFGLKGMIAGINAAGGLIEFIRTHLNLPVDHISAIKTYSVGGFMGLDPMTAKNLELTESLQDGSSRNTLLSVLDATQTAMGGRLLRRLVKQPLIDASEIVKRQQAIEELIKRWGVLEKLRNLLSHVRDLERLMMRISTGFCTPKDLAALRFSLEYLPQIKEAIVPLESDLMRVVKEWVSPLPKLTNTLAKTLVEDPPLRVSDGDLIREGFDPKLDELLSLKRNGQQWLEEHCQHLRDSLGIKTLRVGFNKVFGYFIEVSKGQADQMPDTFIRRQTLANSERFISPALKEFETKVLGAEEEIAKLEQAHFVELRAFVIGFREEVVSVAKALALLDCLASLAFVAKERGYIRPKVDDSEALFIRGGRHPVIEQIHASEPFVSNDTLLDPENSKVLLITGPNMAGKSTYIRQTALLTIMAQIGSFIPVESAHIGIVDKVFTRVGASDDLSRGQSTFMVEMTETANILHNATSRSLVILDEIGRGTSTYDGIAIAWSVAEYLIQTKGRQAKTLFATHYFELTDLEKGYPGVANYHVAVREVEGDVIFLRKVIPGIADKSYGVHVARLAGLPLSVIHRGSQILKQLEEHTETQKVMSGDKKKLKKKSKKNCEIQLSLFQNDAPPPPKPNPAVEELRFLDVNTLTPLEALSKLFELQNLARQD